MIQELVMGGTLAVDGLVEEKVLSDSRGGWGV